MSFKIIKKTPIKANGNDGFIEELSQALKEVGGWGSVEIYIQNGKVTQITRRAIKKTNHRLSAS